METTRHFVATVYVVNDGAVALHRHDSLEMWLPPGGHIEQDELPHEAAKREIREELGVDVDLIAPQAGISSATAQSLPRPQQFLLEDINVCEGEVGHQHIDFIYYGTVDHRDLDPAPGEAPADAWEWYDITRLRAQADTLPEDVVDVGCQAIRTVREDSQN